MADISQFLNAGKTLKTAAIETSQVDVGTTLTITPASDQRVLFYIRSAQNSQQAVININAVEVFNGYIDDFSSYYGGFMEFIAGKGEVVIVENVPGNSTMLKVTYQLLEED